MYFCLYVAYGSWVCQGYFTLTVNSGINSKHLIMPQNMSQQEAERIDGSASKLRSDTDQNINLTTREICFILIRNRKGFIY